ncbi:SusC/RagA family TonB-linked outer membrane protein [Flavobacterium sp. 17A]|uniref:SusC/RagA family TonB-linked outer membrane protein n=1 Tax=Flavobacterium potami TaxID=2872310 RepID=A0A9X1H7T3_9FLAO|nr:SusC/RagA family TonB-linked outer membrane protein [Flavobacterium potami]MBZ4033514.1 SusC/RagA family TonB-linked outer membrane protein [Flavobacterium potami]
MTKILQALLLFLAIAGYSQESRTISGIVLDETDKSPVPGASIFVENNSISSKTAMAGIIQSESIGTTSDFDGKFQLKVPKNVTALRITFMGYKAYTLDLSSSQKEYTISLKSDIGKLQEVVVTGYQKIEKRKLTSAIAKVDMADIQQAGVASVDQMLLGQVAGVAVTTPSGAPGAPAKIRIRGTASLNGSQDPLWVLDGLPLESQDVPKNYDKDNIDLLTNYSIAGLNPDDIKDITILKDAAATSIYGARAANGVIVITTKKGKSGKMTINVNTNTFVTLKPDFDKLNLMNANQKVDFELGLASRSDLTYRDTNGQVARILNGANELDTFRNGGFSALSPATQNSINALRNNNFNWGNLIYQNAINTQHGLSMSGGGEKSDYYFSTGFYDEQGTTIGTGFKRYNLTLKNNYEVSDRFKVGVGLFGSESITKSYVTDVSANTNPSNYVRNVNPYLTPFNADGSYNYDQDITGYSDRYIPFNIVEERANTSYDIKTRAIKAILDAEYKITDHLKANSQLGLQLDHSGTEKYAGQNSYYTRRYREKSRYFSNGNFNYFLPNGGVIENSNNDFFQYNLKTTLNYSNVFADKHEVEIMVGNELRRNYQTAIFTKGFGFDENTLTTQQIVFPNADMANNSEYKTYRKEQNENAYASFFATASYTYNRKYTFFGSARYDGSNLFGVDPKYKYLPLWSTSAAWLVSQENFLKDSNVISNLRLRGSYGLQGNVDKNTSPFVVGENKTTTILPGQIEPTIVVINPPNEKLRWEKTTSTNIGADLGLFHNRISIIADVYGRKSADLLGNRSLPLENGFEFTNMNWAQVTNKGFELSIATKNIDRPNFKWTTNFNLAQNKSNVDRIEVRDTDYMPNKEGRPVNAIFGFKTNGIDENGNPLFVNKKGETVNSQTFFGLYDVLADVFPGAFSQSNLSAAEFRDLFTYLGDRDPKYTGGITNTFKVGNFDLAIVASFTLDQTMVETPPYYGAEVDRGLNYSTRILNAWSPTNTSSNLPGITSQTSGTGDSWMAYQWYSGGNQIKTMNYLDTWVNKMSYMRLNSMRLGYTLPKAFTDQINISSIRLNVEARNLFVISSDFKGYFDPETYGNIYAQPVPKSFTIGCNVTF